MDSRDLIIEPTILADRIRAVLKNEYPHHYEVNVHCKNIKIDKIMSGPVWDPETKDAIGFPLLTYKIEISAEVAHRTDFNYLEVITDGKK